MIASEKNQQMHRCGLFWSVRAGLYKQARLLLLLVSGYPIERNFGEGSKIKENSENFMSKELSYQRVVVLGLKFVIIHVPDGQC